LQRRPLLQQRRLPREAVEGKVDATRDGLAHGVVRLEPAQTYLNVDGVLLEASGSAERGDREAFDLLAGGASLPAMQK
jgi:hypothetical protein